MKLFCQVLLLSAVLASGMAAADTISCKDELGQNVDWFYAYKLPQIEPTTKGTEFLYLKPGLTNWVRSTATIDSPKSMIALTMAQAYANASAPNQVVVAYNDSPPDQTASATCGHTNGVVVANDQSGFWVVHSVPTYPNITENPADYAYPWSAHMYGQSFLCISVQASQVDKIGLQLVYNEPQIYVFQISDNLSTLYPNLVNAGNMKTISAKPYNSLATITSTAGVSFQSFAKGAKFKQELYEDWVAPTLQTDLYVEAWRYGDDLLPSNCNQTQKVWNVAAIEMDTISFNFTTCYDHSKWAVNDPASAVPWICVGDINRASYQEIRGGGTVCLSSATVASAYFNLISDFDEC